MVDVSPRTAVSYLHKLGYYGSRAARRKPHLHPTNIKQRKDWVHEMVERALAFFMSVIFSDELQISVFSDSGRVWVWRLNNQEFDIKTSQSTEKLGGNSVMLWGDVRSDGRSELAKCQGNISSVKNASILQECLLPYSQVVE